MRRGRRALALGAAVLDWRRVRASRTCSAVDKMPKRWRLEVSPPPPPCPALPARSRVADPRPSFPPICAAPRQIESEANAANDEVDLLLEDELALEDCDELADVDLAHELVMAEMPFDVSDDTSKVCNTALSPVPPSVAVE